MNLEGMNFTEDNHDCFYDWINDLMISKDIYYRFYPEIYDSDFSEEFEYKRNDDSIHQATVRASKKSRIINLSCIGHEPASVEVWAIKVGNGWLVTDPLTISLG